MTENAIKYQELQEKKRSNRVKEDQNKYQKFKDITSGIGTMGRGIGSLGSVVGTLNDASWYNLDKQLVKDSASISFDNPLGAQFEDSFNGHRIFPGIMAINLGHTLGDRTAITHAAQNIYSFVRHANSGSRNYQPNDMISYFLAMSDVYSFHSWMGRLYSLLLTAKGHNRYYFNTMIKAAGGDPVTLRTEIAQFRAYINSFAIRANAYFVPKDLTLFQRRYWLYSNIFKDKDIKKSQTYIFNPYALGIYDDTTSTLKAKAADSTVPNDEGWRPNGLATLNTIRAFGDRMLSSLLDSADIGIMAGDVLKAYGEGNLHFLPTIPEEYHIEAIYSEEVLSQIHNAILIGAPCSVSSRSAMMFDVRCPSTGSLSQGFGTSGSIPNNNRANLYMYINATETTPITSNNIPNFGNVLLNMYKDDVSPDEVMVATRLMVTGCTDINDVDIIRTNEDIILPSADGLSAGTVIEASANNLINITTCGTEIAVNAKIYTLDSAGNETVHDYKTTFRNNTSAQRVYTIAQEFIVSKFDWAPYQRLITIVGTDNIFTYDNDFLDAANYATLSKQTLKNIHYTAIMSEYGVPLLGTKVRSR